jgi:MYXO-CTERM domain-containing protein
MYARTASFIILAILCNATALAIPFGGVEFPAGATSFADAVVSYDPTFGGGAAPNPAFQVPSRSLAPPDNVGLPLGAGGRLVLRFTDNSLIGSGSPALDLWVFEIGPDVEDTFVDISKNGTAWFSVGKVFGATSGIDIDAFGFGASDAFSFVRLTDDINEGQVVGGTVGADIDAVGAISSAPPPPPNPVAEPHSLALLGAALLALLGSRRRATQ